MNPHEFLRKSLDMGDKVELTLKDYAGSCRVTVFFRGYRIFCRAGVSDGPWTLIPVFVKPTKKDGTMGRIHYGHADGEIPTLFGNIDRVKIIKRIRED